MLQFPSDPNELLLSRTLANGQFLTNRAAVVDRRVGDGHVVMFAILPFWRWQTHGHVHARVQRAASEVAA